MNLADLNKPVISPPMITIVGSPGAGKTTLGALFPNPIFVQVEDGSSVFDTWDEDLKPTVFPQLRSSDTKECLLEQLRMLLNQDHDFKTLVVDSVSSLDVMFQKEVCDIYKVDNVAEAAGGYHKGYLVVSNMHAEIKRACDILKKTKGMSIVFLAHSGIKKMKNRPDADEYTVYTLDMHEASIQNYVNLVDAVVYLKNEEFVKGHQSDKKGNTTKFGKTIYTGQRVIITSGDGTMGYINAKNRYNLENTIPVDKGENPLLDLITYFRKGSNS